MSEDAARSPQELPAIRVRRAHLRRACEELEAALAAPLAGPSDDWARQVVSAVVRTRQAFAAHVSITEGRDGLFEQVRAEAPRLDGALRRLHREHGDIAAQLAAAGAQLETPDEAALQRAREQLTTVLAGLSRHRQRGADLLYQAYDIDIGGE